KYEECSDKNKIGQKYIATFRYDRQVTLVIEVNDLIEVDNNKYIPSAAFIKR
ncbi:MAG: hypothetical protein HOI53_04270, partial [Francisellaceae bacterium]|nr:hypothetical protein [Francisellaceae bacterium]